METYQSRDEVRRAYERLNELEESNQTLLEEDPELDSLEENLQTQSRIMTAIENWEKQHPEPARQLRSSVEQTIRAFAELRRSNRELVQELADRIDDRMQSLDQSMEVMRHYMQGRRRSEERHSLRIDREV